MSYRPGDTLYVSFTTQNVTGAATDADAAPTVALRRNGAADMAVTVSVAHNGSGDYTASAVIPLTYSGGDALELLISAAVGGIASKAPVSLGKLDRTAQAVAQVICRSNRVHFVSTAGNWARDGLSPETAKALPTQPAPGAGETVLVFGGSFALGTGVIDLSGDGTTGVHLLGGGMGATVITSNALLSGPGCIVKPGNGSQVCDLTIQGTAAVGGSTDQYQAPLGAAASQSPFTGAVIRRVQLVGDSDALYIRQTTSLVTLAAYDCLLRTRYDAVNFYASAASQCQLHNCVATVIGPSTCNAGTIARAVTCQQGTVDIFGGALSASNGTTSTAGVQTVGSGAANLHNVDLASASSTGTVYDLDNSGGSLTAFDCAYSPQKTHGAIGVQNIAASLAAAQNFNNTGQTTPVPSAAAFGGPHAVTLAFHDAAGHPVGGVIFTVVGVGSAVADGSGAQTVALPSGAFTVQALPVSGTLWPTTSITVSADATFTFTGTAITIPIPVNPAQTTAYLTTRDGQGRALPGVTLTFKLIDPQTASDSYDQTAFTATSDSAAALQVALLKSTQYQARVGGGAWVAFTTGSAGSFALPEILGTYA